MDLLTKAHPQSLIDLGSDWLREISAKEDGRLLIWDRSGTGEGFDGFAALEHSWPEVWFLANFAITDAARGDGQAFIAAMLEVIFGELQAHRIFCDAAFDNPAGIRAFTRAGFTHEGTIRQCWKRDGIWVDCEALAILASDWRARKGL